MADTKISALTAATAAAGADVLPIVQGGTTKKLTFTSLWAQGVAAAGGFTNAARCMHTGGVPATQTTDGNDTTPSTTETYFAEVHIDSNVTLTGIALFNGTVATGNVCVALADSTGAIVAECNATAMAGTDTYQRVPFTATYAAVGPATYYALVQFSSTSARFNTHIVGNFGASKKTGETFDTFTTITPPTTFTTALGPIASLY